MNRNKYLEHIKNAFAVHPVVALLGPRQVGKTTLARQYIEQLQPDFPYLTNYFDLENPAHLGRLQNPQLALESLRGVVVIDEIQKIPDLFPLLRVLVDRPDSTVRFLILGSASRDLLQQSAETLAGRIQYLEVHPFSLAEVGEDATQQLWWRGGLPRSYLADSDTASSAWREAYIRTFLERDIPQLGIQIPALALRRFWMMLAHYHGQIFQASEIGRSLDTTDTTVRRYLDILAGTLMIRRLTPWFENIGKRQVKRPKIYFRDSGLLHTLLGIDHPAALQVHPKLGASWEGFVLEEILRLTDTREEDAYYWAVHQQMELDLLLLRHGKRIGFEIKYGDTPKITKAHHEIVRLLQLDRLYFITPTAQSYAAADRIHVAGLAQLPALLAP